MGSKPGLDVPIWANALQEKERMKGLNGFSQYPLIEESKSEHLSKTETKLNDIQSKRSSEIL